MERRAPASAGTSTPAELQQREAPGSSTRRSGVPGEPTIVCTIVSKNYLSYARTLMESVSRHHGELFRAVLLVDDVEGYFDPEAEPFRVFLASNLGIPNWRHMSMKYEITELSTAVKPYFLEMLFEKFEAKKVVFFDPDILVYRELDELLDLLDRYTVVLTPHILDPVEDAHHPGELDFLRVGVYNLGFLALSRQGSWRRLLHWWQRRLYTLCTREPERGVFVDQHWMDLAPCLYEGVHVLRDPGYNVAYWNLAARNLERRGATYEVNGRPLTFFHYSGFVYDDPERVSIHQNRFVLSELSEAYRDCFEEYRARLSLHGYQQTSRWPYSYSSFRNGAPVSNVLRICLRRLDPEGARWPEPYDISEADSFLAWATYPREDGSTGVASHYLLTLHAVRKDLQQFFPIPLSDDGKALASWFVQQKGDSDVFHPVYLEPIARGLSAAMQQGAEAQAEQEASVLGETNRPDTDPPREQGATLPSRTQPARLRRLLDAIGYYRSYPTKVAPVLPPGLIDIVPEPYTGPAGIYGWVRKRLAQAGMLQQARRLIGLRLILTFRYFFSDSQVTAFAMVSAARGREWERGNGGPPAIPRHPVSKNGAGVNVIGFLSSESGVGEVARRVLRCLERVHVPVAQLGIQSFSLARKNDDSAQRFPYGTPNEVNVFTVNADMTFAVRDHLGSGVYDGRYNVGFWFWELASFPERFRTAFEVYHEIWVASGFAQAAVSARANVPVVRVPIAVDVDLPPIGRRELGLPETAFVVLFVFDALSVVERKNPWCAIRAFEKAFPHELRRGRARLVMKVTNLHLVPEEARRLREEMNRVDGILIEDYFDRLRINALIASCDVYLSLHRSEGFGLTIAEAMFLAKPVIATAYSGNMDFMTPDNSYLVPYRLVELERAYSPYDRGGLWAEPDCDAAASMLRSVFENQDEWRARGARARETMLSQYHPELVGRQIRSRLELIRIELGRSD